MLLGGTKKLWKGISNWHTNTHTFIFHWEMSTSDTSEDQFDTLCWRITEVCEKKTKCVLRKLPIRLVPWPPRIGCAGTCPQTVIWAVKMFSVMPYFLYVTDTSCFFFLFCTYFCWSFLKTQRKNEYWLFILSEHLIPQWSVYKRTWSPHAKEMEIYEKLLFKCLWESFYTLFSAQQTESTVKAPTAEEGNSPTTDLCLI